VTVEDGGEGVRFLVTVMGVPMSVDVRDPATPQVRAAVADAFELLRDAERRFSRHRPGSEVARLDRGELRLQDASSQLVEVLAIAEKFSRDSGGVFGIERPDGTLDLDGVVKGWAAQRAADLLVGAGIERFCLNAGGDVVVRGGRAPGEQWRLAVRTPWVASEHLAVVALTDGALATSGTYERGPHVYDARSGRTAADLVSVTVLAGDLVTADVLATTVLALGRGGARWAHERYGCSVLTVDADDVVDAVGPGLAPVAWRGGHVTGGAAASP